MAALGQADYRVNSVQDVIQGSNPNTPAAVNAQLDVWNTSSQAPFTMTYQFETAQPGDLWMSYSGWTAMSGAEQSAIRAVLDEYEFGRQRAVRPGQRGGRSRHQFRQGRPFGRRGRNRRLEFQLQLRRQQQHHIAGDGPLRGLQQHPRPHGGDKQIAPAARNRPRDDPQASGSVRRRGAGSARPVPSGRRRQQQVHRDVVHGQPRQRRQERPSDALRHRRPAGAVGREHVVSHRQRYLYRAERDHPVDLGRRRHRHDRRQRQAAGRDHRPARRCLLLARRAQQFLHRVRRGDRERHRQRVRRHDHRQ